MRNIPFRIVGIETVDLSLKEDFVFSEDNHNVDVNTEFSFAVNKDLKMVKCIIDYSYQYHADEILKMSLACVFKIENDAFASMLQGDKFVIEPFFSRYLATINIGAARGEIHARCDERKSNLKDIILPPINLGEALKGDVVIELK